MTNYVHMKGEFPDISVTGLSVEDNILEEQVDRGRIGTPFGRSELEAFIIVACEAVLTVLSVRSGTLESGLLSFLLLCLTVTFLDDTRRSETSYSYGSFNKQEGVSRKGGQVKGRRCARINKSLRLAVPEDDNDDVWKDFSRARDRTSRRRRIDP